MSSMILIAICLLLGALARRTGRLPEAAPKVLNVWVIDVALPALVLRVIHRVPMSTSALAPIASLWVTFVIAVVIASIAMRRFGVDRRRAAALALGAGLGNTAFLGLALLEALGGPGVLGAATLIDQLGSFLVLACLAMPIAAIWGGHAVTPRQIAKKVLTFPPFIALMLALISRSFVWPPVIDEVLERLALTLSPIALASVGAQLDASAFVTYRREITVGLAYKLAIAPLIVYLGLRALDGELTELDRVAIAQAAMPTMVSAGVLALEHDLEPRLVASMIALGVPLGMMTVSAWWWWLG